MASHPEYSQSSLVISSYPSHPLSFLVISSLPSYFLSFVVIPVTLVIPVIRSRR